MVDQYTRYDVADIAQLAFPPEHIDLLPQIDPLYFTGLIDTLGLLKRTLKPSGTMAIFSSYGCLPWEPLVTFPKENVRPGRVMKELGNKKPGKTVHI